MTSYALLPMEAKYIAKASLFSVPFGGWGMWFAGDIAIHFTSEKGGWGVKKGTTAKMFDYIRYLVHELHLPVMCYPEGTRDGTLILKPFKPGMLQFAAENDCYVLPMAVSGVEVAWPYPGPFFDTADIHISIGPLIKPNKDQAALTQTVIAAIQQLIDDIPKYPTTPTRHTDANAHNTHNNTPGKVAN